MIEEKEMPLVSVVIISYNQGNFLEDSLKSVLSQTYKNIDILIIDNNSSDNESSLLSKNISEKYGINFLKRKDRMLTKALNEALNIVDGKYLCFIAADDIMINNRIELQVNYLETSESNIAACFGNQIKINDYGQLIGISKIMKEKIIDFKEVFTSRVNLYAPTSMYKAKALKHIGGFDINHKVEDLSIYLKLTNNNYKLLRVENPLSLYRIHSNNTHTKYMWMMKEQLKIWNDYKENYLYKKGIENIYLEHFSNFGSKNKIECIKLIPKIFHRIDSKYWWFGFIRLFFDFRSINKKK